ncbi:nucleotide sugar dehydrogenase [Aulographum hederae CBS 113979]|uniref:UDP-glucose 6-dehydrogenase n=1 Tax=Aulographum hederae CBS 113979 TaxID=1176131 RepID=A0A6G1H041_9PEZI|nr:nucleotide sugar dehydrogenase [Aulographum hederae CBS 113979]
MSPSIELSPAQSSNGSSRPAAVRTITPGAEHLSRTMELLSLPHGRVQNICCIGAGYVGGPTCAVIANKNPHLKVTVVDLSQPRIDAWNSPHLPIYEPGLQEIVELARDGSADRKPNLFFSTDVDAAIAEADLVFVSVNTPTKVSGTGAGFASELSYVESAIRKIAEVATTDKIVVEKSTVPVRTADSMREILSAIGKPGVRFEVLSNPEFLAEGTAIPDLLTPDRILIGSLVNESGLSAASALANVYAGWVPRDRIITMNLWSSELAKLAANALLAQRISSINALSAICEATGADVEEIAFACGTDTRIGSKMLRASVGFGGSCFKKDILSLTYISETLHLPEVAAYWRSVVDINEYQKDRFTNRIITCLYNSLTNKKIAVLGFSYKKDTGDTRESAAISIIKNLAGERAKISIYDPKVEERQIWQDLQGYGNVSSVAGAGSVKDFVTVENNVYDACADAHAIIILTEWDEFSNKAIAKPTAAQANKPTNGHASTNPRMDWSRVADTMKRPMFVFDGRNVVDARALEELGFRVECIGKPGTNWAKERMLQAQTGKGASPV